VAERMNGVRAVLDGYRQFVNADGLVQIPYGPNFNFMDWVPGWYGGAAPDGGTGINGPHNWQRVLVLRQAAQLEEWMGEPEMAARWRRYAIEAEQAITTTFWDEQRGLFADDMKHEHYSEHSQCLAILAHELGGGLSETQRQRIAHGLLNDSDLARTTIYFTHYLFETYRVLGVMDHFFERMQGWFELKAQGLKNHHRNARAHTLRLPRVGRASSVPLLRISIGHSSGRTWLQEYSHRAATGLTHQRTRRDGAPVGRNRSWFATRREYSARLRDITSRRERNI
jgi:hypothetical protein